MLVTTITFSWLQKQKNQTGTKFIVKLVEVVQRINSG